MTKEVTKKEEQNLSALEELFGGGDETYESGFEGTTSDTFKTPFVKILQTLSPEVKKTDPKYIEGAEEGMFCNTATGDLYTEMDLIVLKVEHSLIVWKPSRGGFVGRHPKKDEEKIVSEKIGVQKWDSEGNDVVDTIELFCINANSLEDIFILPLSNASMKYAKKFATRLRMLKNNGKAIGVSWAGIWNIKSVEESNEKGSWHTIGETPDFIRLVTKELRDNVILPARDMLKTAETDYASIENADGSDSSDEDMTQF